VKLTPFSPLFLARRIGSLLLILILLVVVGTSAAFARSDPRPLSPEAPQNAASPGYSLAEHNIGNLRLSVCNNGTFGNGWSPTGEYDYFTGERALSCEYPKDSRTTYLWAADLWIGAIVGRDTLVSTGGDGGSEFHPDERRIALRSTIDPAKPEFEGAVSEQDYIAIYYDTCRRCSGVGNDWLDHRGHRPLNIEVTQRSFAWSYAYADDFVLFDYAIRNIGQDRLRRVYMGLYVDADVHSLAQLSEGYEDDLSGFKTWLPALYLKPPCPSDSDRVNLAWTIDNDGGLEPGPFPPTPHVAAMRIVRTPADSLVVSYNWWIRNSDPRFDFGPQARATYRDLGTGGLGMPSGDRNKFHYLRNGEVDYDQPTIATIGSLDSIWLPPPPDRVAVWATGLDVRYLLSFGPFEVEPGQTLPISLAYVCGSNFHRNPDNFLNLPNNPDAWYEGVNFDSLGVNATWADWIYDNPGVDTDSDGYAGRFTVCNLGDDSSWVCDTSVDTAAEPDTVIVTCGWQYELADTVWREGDGVPDFRGASPPPAPSAYSIITPSGEQFRGLRVEPEVGRIKIRWNGVMSENTRDIFSREVDFEGYRVYIGRDDRSSSYSVAASYDLEDYNRWEFNPDLRDYQLLTRPYSLQELRCMYADSCNDTSWHPLDYTRSHPLVLRGWQGRDRVYYFTPQDFNRSVLGHLDGATTDIRKTFPSALKPPVLEPDSIRLLFPGGADTVYLTPEGFVKYYEYEYTMENLLPTVPYWINVTAFDYGSPKSGLAALETSPTLSPVVTYALQSVDQVEALGLKVFVYPNPYRVDDNYREAGFEGRLNPDMPEERTRMIHFANLPARCTIRIFSLDGDLIREIEHDVDPADPLANHDVWDMITRNSQSVVSGLYYWSVEDNSGNTQVGKLVILL